MHVLGRIPTCLEGSITVAHGNVHYAVQVILVMLTFAIARAQTQLAALRQPPFPILYEFEGPVHYTAARNNVTLSCTNATVRRSQHHFVDVQ